MGNNIEVINLKKKRELEVIDVSQKNKSKRTKLNSERKEEYINVKISKNKFKKAMIRLLIIAAIALAAKLGYDAHQAEEQRQEIINQIIESDNYLDDLVVYVSDSGSEIWEKNEQTGLQEPVRDEEVAEYINNMEDLTEELKEDLADHFGVTNSLSSTHKR